MPAAELPAVAPAGETRGFDWSAAGAGFGVALGVVALATGGAVFLRRHGRLAGT